ncbi:MAG: OsmC family peroxiredoxin [Gemmatimonadaceae bacterium]
MPTRKASATWEGGLKGGKGSFSGESGTVKGAYSFGSRFENAPASNPEELLAAAEAACFSMALSGALEKNGTPPTKIETTAACSIEKSGEGFRISGIKLTVRVNAKGTDAQTLKKLAEQTKEGCPVSAAFKGNVKLEVEATLA